VTVRDNFASGAFSVELHEGLEVSPILEQLEGCGDFVANRQLLGFAEGCATISRFWPLERRNGPHGINGLREAIWAIVANRQFSRMAARFATNLSADKRLQCNELRKSRGEKRRFRRRNPWRFATIFPGFPATRLSDWCAKG
jgi:hypothetical protein